MPDPRRITQGMVFTSAELTAGTVTLTGPDPHPDPPPGQTRGEPWGWTKGAPYPRGWKEDGQYDAQP